MVAEVGFEPHDLRVMRNCSCLQCRLILYHRICRSLIFQGGASRTISILCHTVSKNIMAVGVSVGVKSIFDDHTTPPKHSLGFDTVKKIVLGVQNRIPNSSSGFLLSNKYDFGQSIVSTFCRHDITWIYRGGYCLGHTLIYVN